MNFLFVMVTTIAIITAPLCVFLFRSREQLREELTKAREKNIALESRKEAGEQRLSEQQQSLTAMQEQLRLEFRNTANAIFDDISKKFSTQSEKQIGTLLDPLRERLGEFQKKVDESFGTQAKEQFSLRKEIERIVGVSDNLAKALRGDVKVQGGWGEVMLERILEESGLRKNTDYILQGGGLGLRGAGENLLKPDVIVNLPDNKHIIIDAKISLTAYERYCGEADDLQRILHLKEFLKSVKGHVNGLEQRRYQDIESLGTPDFVLMFMPMEGAYALAVQQDRELHSYAWDRKIVIVCPATLFATLRTIASLWRMEMQNRNAKEIAEEGGKLYDKFIGLAEDMLKMGDGISKMQGQYEQIRSKLKEGKGNLISRVEKLRQLGAKTTKALPKELIIEPEAEELEESA
jgi:DNA recombination protein RmuC